MIALTVTFGRGPQLADTRFLMQLQSLTAANDKPSMPTTSGAS
jgi:hypothetical protein